jgi:hypothetical protein
MDSFQVTINFDLNLQDEKETCHGQPKNKTSNEGQREARCSIKRNARE